MSLPRQRLFGAVIALSLLAAGGAASGSSLDQQLDIQPYNATQGPARNVADRWLQLAAEQLQADDYSAALASWAKAAEIYEAIGDYEALGRTYDNMGITLARLGRYNQAEQLLRRRIAIARDNRQLASEVYGLNNLGTLLLQRGHLNAAATAFTDALAIAEAISHDAGIGLSLSNLGLIASIQGNLSDALKYYEAATGYRYAAGDSLGEANSSNSLGDLYRRLGRDGDAIGAYRVALNNSISLNDTAAQLRAIDGLLSIYLEREEWRDVEILLDRRSALTLDGQRSVQTVLTLTYLGDYYRALGEINLAKETYQQALTLARSLEARPQTQQLVNRLIELG